MDIKNLRDIGKEFRSLREMVEALKSEDAARKAAAIRALETLLPQIETLEIDAMFAKLPTHGRPAQDIQDELAQIKKEIEMARLRLVEAKR